jgi:hypothetical protein
LIIEKGGQLLPHAFHFEKTNAVVHDHGLAGHNAQHVADHTLVGVADPAAGLGYFNERNIKHCAVGTGDNCIGPAVDPGKGGDFAIYFARTENADDQAIPGVIFFQDLEKSWLMALKQGSRLFMASVSKPSKSWHFNNEGNQDSFMICAPFGSHGYSNCDFIIVH